MSQAAGYGQSGGGGGGAVDTLTPNSGGAVSPVSNNINDQGLAANSGGNAYPLFSYNGGAGQMNWENRTYLSAYVVDTSSTPGSLGTFSTLAAAITQAIADGATGDGITIFLRDITINETITVSTSSVKITISGPSGINSQNQGAANPVFSGSFTNSGTGAITFNGINISGTITNSGSGQIYLNNGVISGTIANSSTGSILVTNCFGSGETVNISHGIIGFTGCSLSGTDTLSNDGHLALFYTLHSGTITGSSSVGVDINNCYLPLAAFTLSSGVVKVQQSGFGLFNFYGNTGVTYELLTSTQGNILQSIRSAISYTVLSTDYYIGITSTSSARTVTLPSTLVIKGQSFIIKDESGAAGTNNISIAVNGGTKTIDGLTSFPINTNFGSINVTYDGTNYFTF